MLIRCSEDNFIYDVHSLFKAFYPAEDIRVIPASKENDDDEAGFAFIEYKKDRSVITLYDDGKEEVTESEITENDRVDYKNKLKRAIYRALSKKNGIELPWGTLTGIRPTKIALTMLEAGNSDEEILEYYDRVYLTGKGKALLAVDIAHRELQILSNIHYDEGYSIYIGIPFCPSTCLYCSFTSFPRIAYEKQIGEYIACLKKEIDHVAESFKEKIADSVYIGGGTPTTLTPAELEDLIGYLKSRINFDSVKEFTVEAGRADSITREKLEVLKRMGVTRISVNPQTFKQETLDIIGRRHTVEQVIEAYKTARELGFDNINMDMIVGLPGENKADVANTLETIAKLSPDSVTVHSLAVKRASRLNEWISEHGRDFINSEEIMDMTEKMLRDIGLEPYYLYRQKNMSGNMENVGYAKKGKEGIYNILIMEEKQSIVALGAGTVTKRVFHEGDNYRMERCDNVKDVRLYIEKIDEMIDRKRKLFL